MGVREFAEVFDHTNLKPESTAADIGKLCDEAIEHHFGAVCVNPSFVKLAAERLDGTGVKVCTVIGFPLGACPPEVKAFATRKAVEDGAVELDMVLNIGALRGGDEGLVERDIGAVVEAAAGNTTKVILETCFLTDEQVVRACEIAKKAGADFVKTSTGFGPAGATEEHIRLMRETVGPDMGVKASGGIRDLEKALKMLEAGATRIGASASVKIIGEYEASLSGHD
ncbi:MAG: deoxyribose-phosphate aldolase [Promethearchaeota archaeon]